MPRRKGEMHADSLRLNISAKVSITELLAIEADLRAKGFKERSEYIRAAIKAFQQRSSK